VQARALRAALWWSLSLQAVGLQARALPSAAEREKALAPEWALVPVW
jgi:hypothetical protein